MKIKNTTLINFRSAKNISLEFDKNLNIFVGINGSGKTTILDALSISLSWVIKKIQRQSASGTSIADTDISNNQAYSKLQIVCEETNKDYTWDLIKVIKGKSIDEKTNLKNVNELAKYFQNELHNSTTLPVICYYPVTRLVGNANPKVKQNTIFDVYDNALGGKQNFQSFFDWFRSQDDIVNEIGMQRKRWIKENRATIQKHVDLIISILEINIFKINEKINYQSKSFSKNKNEEKYYEPDVLIYEIFNLIEEYDYELNYEFNYKFNNWKSVVRAFKDLIAISEEKSMDLYSHINLFEEINSIGCAELYKNDLKYIYQVNYEIYSLIFLIKFWWIKESNRIKIQNILYKSLNDLDLRGFNYPKFLTDTLSNSINYIIENEFNEKILKENNVNSGKELEIVKKAIETFVPEYSNLTIRRTPTPHLVITKNKEEFNLDQLSAGEKNLITLVGDIARRLAIANPTKDALNGAGIILIDEIDLHLHPSWQRKLISHLVETFPNCQFFITTHSPQVISEVKPQNLFLLKNEGNDLTFIKATESYGKNTDRILEDLLETDARPTQIKKSINELYKLISDNELDEAKIKIDELSKIIIGGDPELTKAKVLLTRKSILGK